MRLILMTAGYQPIGVAWRWGQHREWHYWFFGV